MRIRLNKKIIVSVISDVVTDQRVQKECNTLYNIGYDVLVIGRKSNNVFMLAEFPYKVVRFYNLFRRGPFMYLVFNLQLFFYLLFKKADILWANDLDTLLPNFIISRLKKVKLVYDSHEYFTLSVYKKTSRKVWERLERLLFPKLKNVITVNDSIKKVYEEKYKVPLTVIRNVPYKNSGNLISAEPLFPPNKKILLIQGIGINENRGAEEAVLTMQFLPEDFNLYFIGTGTIITRLRKMVRELKLEGKIIFLDVLPYQSMMKYTRQSFLGLIFEKIHFNDEHMFSLPNRFFDYIKAGIPVLSSKAVEIKAVIDKYNIGDLIDTFKPEQIAEKIIAISKDPATYDLWKQNTKRAADELCWENEEKKLIDFMHHLS
ncbi:MAG TPA: glycosyltransferase [Chitinophagaceae bacterium]|nr:glycosyltransferase [Chitinophagaceae bacterium]